MPRQRDAVCPTMIVSAPRIDLLRLLAWYTLIVGLVESHNSHHPQREFSTTLFVGWYNGSPDGYTRPILAVNNTFPAPTITVNKGDRVRITVVNLANQSTTIHWHGLDQRKTVNMDGVPSVTQCPIHPNSSYTYVFNTGSQAGTFWYHAHFAIQYGDGLKGAFIIQDPDDPWKKLYTDEDILQLSEWNHTPLYVLLGPFLSGGTIEPVPDTGLINNIGQYNCSSSNTCSYYQATIRPNSAKRFRIISTAVYVTITLTIDQHVMRVIEADGINLDGTKYLRTLRLNAGQRYSILVEAKQNHQQSYWIRATLHPTPSLIPGTYNTALQPNVSAILQYVQNSNGKPPVVKPLMSDFNNDAAAIYQSILDAREYADQPGLVPMNIHNNRVPTKGNIRTFVFDLTIQLGHPGAFYLNDRTFTHEKYGTRLAALLKSNRTELYSGSTVRIENGEIIDVVINNIFPGPHPFHLHGHHAWLLATGPTGAGFHNQSTAHQIVYNTVNPIYRDTYTLNPLSYFAVRFKADNPGLWMMHCHNDWHLQLGLAMLFVESPSKVRKQFADQPGIAQSQSVCSSH